MTKQSESASEDRSANRETSIPRTTSPLGTQGTKSGKVELQRSAVIAQLEPLRSESTAGLIAGQIRDALMAGTLGPGSQLAEAELAEQLKVSRGPIREALQRLVQQGVLVEVRNRGVFVPKFDACDVADIYLSRQAIELAAVTTLIENEETNTQTLSRVLRRMNAAAKGTRWSTVAALDAEFHQELVRATGSRRLIRMLDTLLLESRICMIALEDVYRGSADLVTEHSNIFAAIQARDEALAIQLVTDHMKDAAQRLGVLLAQEQRTAGK